MKKSQSKLMKTINNKPNKIAHAAMKFYSYCEDVIYALLAMPAYITILRRKIKKDPLYLKNKLKEFERTSKEILTKYYHIIHHVCVKYSKISAEKLQPVLKRTVLACKTAIKISHQFAIKTAIFSKNVLFNKAIKLKNETINKAKNILNRTKTVTTNTLNNIKQFIVADIKKTTEDVRNTVNAICNGVKRAILSPVYLGKYVIRSIKNFGHKTYGVSCNAIKELNKPINTCVLFAKLKHLVFCKKSQIYVLSAIILGVATLSIKWYNNQLAAIHEQYSAIANKIQNLNQKNASTTGLSNKIYAHVIPERQSAQTAESKSEITKTDETTYDPIAALKNKVENYFAQHKTTEVLASNDKCRLKVDNEVINDHSYIPGLADIHIDGANEDYITFTDNLGNSYSKPIVTLFQ